MNNTNQALYDHKIAVVIPFYNAAAHIENVIKKIPDFIDSIIVVDDCSPQPFIDVYQKMEVDTTRVVFFKGAVNLGVGGATKLGFERAIEMGMEFVVKMDSDDQMDSKYLPELLLPLINGNADYAKGNRFRDFNALRKMPLVRRVGNLGLSFLMKASTGYWNVFDPSNGYFAVRTSILSKIDFNALSNRFFFETSVLGEMYFQRAQIVDVPMAAIYGEEVSNLSVSKVLFTFPRKLLKQFLRRIGLFYFIYDFNIGSVYLLFGTLLGMFGTVFGAIKWIHYAQLNTMAPTGTVMIPTLSIILGVQFLLQFLSYDIGNVPGKSTVKQ